MSFYTQKGASKPGIKLISDLNSNNNNEKIGSDPQCEIFQQAKGAPRVINNMCYACLMEIAEQNKNIVDMPTMEKIMIKLEAK